jgi:hypothetical protein
MRKLDGKRLPSQAEAVELVPRLPVNISLRERE